MAKLGGKVIGRGGAAPKKAPAGKAAAPKPAAAPRAPRANASAATREAAAAATPVVAQKPAELSSSQQFAQQLAAPITKRELKGKDVTPERFPGAVTYNSRFSNSLHSIHKEIASRLDSWSGREGVDHIPGEVTSRADAEYTKAVTNAHLSAASRALIEHDRSNKSGNAADALGWLVEAADHTNNAINFLHSRNYGKRGFFSDNNASSEGITISSGKTGDELHSRLSEIVNGFGNHLRNKGISVPGVTDNALFQRNYRPGLDVSTRTSIPNPTKYENFLTSKGAKKRQAAEGPKLTAEDIRSKFTVLPLEVINEMREQVRRHFTENNKNVPFRGSEAWNDPSGYAVKHGLVKADTAGEKVPNTPLFPHGFVARQLGLPSPGLAEYYEKKRNERLASGVSPAETVSEEDEKKLSKSMAKEKFLSSAPKEIPQGYRVDDEEQPQEAPQGEVTLKAGGKLNEHFMDTINRK